MHSLLTSREQDLATAPKHQALLKNLGIGPLLKSQTHAAALHESLRRGSNHHAHSNAPRDPKGFIRRASPDMTLTPAQRQRAQREESRQEAEQLRRMSEARTNGGITDDEEEIGPDGYQISRDTKAANGSFERLKKALAAKATDSVETLMKSLQSLGRASTMAKSAGIEHGQDFETRYGISNAHVAHVVGRPAVAKPTISALNKSIETVRERLDKILGVTPMQNLNRKIVATSEKLAKSLPTAPVRGLRMAAPQYTVPQVEAAAGAALAHGAIDAQSAQVIANSLALGGVAAVPSALLAKLRGE